MNTNFKAYLEAQRVAVDAALDTYLPTEDEVPGYIHKAMRYSVFAGGKRLRPILMLETTKALGGNVERLMPAACAVECIHTYSLIHDDLPAMDDDELRRGIPTSHRVFGEAMAILAGDALLTFAFLLMSHHLAKDVSAPLVVKAIEQLSFAAGTAGLVGGQVMDLLSEGNNDLNSETLKYIHTHKTGAMIVTSVYLGALLSKASDVSILGLTAYASNLGLAFQIKDDILDIEGDAQTLGKSIGKDAAQQKLTYPAVHGLSQAKEKCQGLLEQALAEIEFLGTSGARLRQLATYLINRTY